MSAPIAVVSSKATEAMLTELTHEFEAHARRTVVLESVGGVQAAARVKAGEAFDVVILSETAIDDLISSGHLVATSKVDLVRSNVAVAVRAGAAHPNIATEAALRQAVSTAKSIGYSTGPSGVALAALFERWGIADAILDRTVIAPVGVPVGTLVACGEVELGFQQLSELLHLEGIDIAGTLPETLEIVTTFSAAIGATSKQPESAAALLDYLASPAAAAAKRRQGMLPA
jgi:molybdate transport system substrate-binding protein